MNSDRRVAPFLLRAATAAVFLTLPLLAYKSFSTSPQPPPASVSNENPAASPAGVNLEQANNALRQLIDHAIEQSDFAGARWGISVISLSEARVLYSRNADRLFTPASNMKLYTTAVALDFLGSDYRWRTSVYADAQPDANGVLRGNLVLYGRGAPDLLSENKKDNNNSLAQLARALAKNGLRRVEGKVIGDESYFRGEPIGQGWQWNDLQWYFGAEASALTVNGNQVGIEIKPPDKPTEMPALSSTDPSGYVRLTNNMMTVKRGEPFRLGINRGLSDNEFRVWGEFPFGNKGYGAQLSVHHPALWAAHLFSKELKAQGIIVDGGLERRDWRLAESERFDPSRLKELGFVESKSLGELVRLTNKFSINLYAELILRTLGREREAMLTSPHPVGRERGDDEAGIELVRLWLARAGILSSSIAIHDGSGLSRLNSVTPDSTARLLLAVSKTSSGSVFRESLPIAGRDGTLESRLNTLAGRVSAKTGSLVYDNALAGYALAENGETLAFSILCNDQTGPGSSVRLIDRIVEILASYPTLSTKTAPKGPL